MTYLPALPALPPQEQPLVTVGDIVVSRSWLVTPVSTLPLAGTEVFVTDFSRTESKTPVWAIVLAIIGVFFFLLGLLFLFVRQNTTTGFVQVTVRNGVLLHTVNIPVASPLAAADAIARADYVRHLAAVATASRPSDA